jgi:hypothetical protein
MASPEQSASYTLDTLLSKHGLARPQHGDGAAVAASTGGPGPLRALRARLAAAVRLADALHGRLRGLVRPEAIKLEAKVG